MKIKAKIIVKGMVQGVGYRYFCYRKAVEYGITGYAKNLFNGDVELEAEGEQNLMKEYVRNLKTGPSNARVNSVVVEELPFEDQYDEFKIY